MCINLQNGFKLFFCSVLFNISLQEAVGQEFKVRTANTDKKTETTSLPRYDGVSPFFDIQELAKNPHYYDNTKILFIPHSSNSYNYYEEFYIKDSIEIPSLNDTIWSKDKKRIKKINKVISNVYKPVRADTGKAYYFGSGQHDLNGGIIKPAYGYATPVSAIDGKVFTVKSCTSTIDKKSSSEFYYLNLNIVLEDTDGVDILWNAKFWMSGKYVFMPIVMYSYIEKYLQFVGKQYVNYGLFDVKDSSSIERVLDDIYKCTELSYLEENRVYASGFNNIYYYSLVLFLTHQGEEIHYNIIPEKNYGWLPGKNSISDESFNSLMEPLAFKQRALKEIEEFNLKLEEIKKTTLKNIEEKKKAEANRLSELTKKYGTKNAKLIMESVVQIGWSKQMCIESWGEPSDINKTITSGSVHEQWVYGNNQYLYFEDGKLTTIQN